MPRIFPFSMIFLIALSLISCSKKNYPTREAANKVNAVNSTTTDSPAATTVAKPKRKVPVSRVILVNDNAAHKSIDGRLYYDLLGRRYWKNYKDGKYYLFNKSMYNNDAFKPKE